MVHNRAQTKYIDVVDLSAPEHYEFGDIHSHYKRGELKIKDQGSNMAPSVLIVSTVVLAITHRGLALSFGVLLRNRLWEQRKKIFLPTFHSTLSSDLHKYPSILGIKACRDSNILMLQKVMNDEEDEELIAIHFDFHFDINVGTRDAAVEFQFEFAA